MPRRCPKPIWIILFALVLVCSSISLEVAELHAHEEECLDEHCFLCLLLQQAPCLRGLRAALLVLAALLLSLPQPLGRPAAARPLGALSINPLRRKTRLNH